MLRSAILALSVLALTACTSGPNSRERYGRYLKPVANPSKVLAAELAFARDWQASGAAAALKVHAEADAVIYGTGIGRSITQYLGDEPDGEVASWQTRKVMVSCDGSLAATLGDVTNAQGQPNLFTNIWRRQRDGDFELAISLVEPSQTWSGTGEFVETDVAECYGSSAKDRVAAYQEISQEMHRDIAKGGITAQDLMSDDTSLAIMAAHASPRDRGVMIARFADTDWLVQFGQRLEEREEETFVPQIIQTSPASPK